MHTLPSSDERCGWTCEVHVTAGTATRAETTARRPTSAGPDEGPSPIAPEPKELLWGLGAFLVFLLADAPVPGAEGEEGDGRPLRQDPRRAREAEATTAAAEPRSPTTRSSSPPCAARRSPASTPLVDAGRRARRPAGRGQRGDRRAARGRRDPGRGGRRPPSGSIEDGRRRVAARVVELSTGRRPDEAAVRHVVADLDADGARS